MRVDEVPQDDLNFYDGHLRSVYAKRPDGTYVQAHSKGWQIETFFTSQALDDLKSEYQQIVEQAKQGAISPLACHMAKRMMTPKLLADHTGFFTFQVKRHLKPHIFARLSQKKLDRYAAALNVKAEDLNRVPE